MLSIKKSVFKRRPARKLIEQYVSPYIIEEVMSANVIKLRLPVLIKHSSL